MEWLSGWLRELILMILVAAFIDLILPSGKTQRYVRVVVSLFILLQLLSPVVQLMRLEIDPERLMAAGMPREQQDDGELRRILRDGEALRAGMDARAAELFGREAGALMKRQLEANFPVVIDRVNITAKGEDGIERVEVFVAAVSQAATGEGREEAERAETTGFGIQPVRPVVVEIRVGRDSAAPSPGGPTVTSSASAYPAQEGPPSTAEPAAAASAPQTPPAATRELAAAMSRWLQQEWGLRPSAIRIAFAAERSAR